MDWFGCWRGGGSSNSRHREDKPAGFLSQMTGGRGLNEGTGGNASDIALSACRTGKSGERLGDQFSHEQEELDMPVRFPRENVEQAVGSRGWCLKER